MQEKIREIVSVFIKIPAAGIGPSTPVDRTAIGNSILLHRMYAKLAEGGVVVANYTSIRNFADLLRQAGGGHPVSSLQPGEGSDPDMAGPGQYVPAIQTTVAGPSLNGDGGSIGIDMQEIGAFPRTHDFRREEFYKMNFSPAEIAYCILQSDPYASFAGLFAAKEAMVKALATYRNKSFDTIAIGHSPEGRPVHPGFHLSISHTGNMAVAVAVPSAAEFLLEQTVVPDRNATPAKNKPSAFWLALFALVLSAIALLIHIIH
ncbi:MAG TPA: 4'-phosphopantetheinyl transferase superfamily protein [Puia sp.]|nr:4'-phosphopantetheinyl transferase superfamily protein [Puia sp.]